jgi:WD40 repeat protein
VAFSPDGKTFASSFGSYGQDGTVKVWNLATGKELASLAHPDVPESLAFSPDGKSLAVAIGGPKQFGDSLWIWEVPSSTSPRGR